MTNEQTDDINTPEEWAASDDDVQVGVVHFIEESIDQALDYSRKNTNDVEMYLLQAGMPRLPLGFVLALVFLSLFIAFPFLPILKLIKDLIYGKRNEKVKIVSLKQSVGLDSKQKRNLQGSNSIFCNKSNGMDNYGLKCKHKVHRITNNLPRKDSIQILRIKGETHNNLKIKSRSRRPTIGITFFELPEIYKTLLDTGSTSSLISLKLLDVLRNKTGLNLPLQKINLTLADYNNNSIPVLGAVELPITIEGIHLKVVFVVVEGTDDDEVLLGAPLLVHHGLAPVYKDGELNIFVSDSQTLIPCRKFYDKNKLINMETVMEVEILPGRSTVAELVCSEAFGQRTNVDGSTAIFSPSPDAGGVHDELQVVNFQRKGKTLITLTNPTRSTLCIAPGYPIGTVKIIDMKDYETAPAGQVMEVVDDFADLERIKLKKCFCEMNKSKMIFRLDKESHEVEEFGSMIGLNDAVKKIEWGTGYQLLPFVRNNQVQGIHFRYHTEKIKPEMTSEGKVHIIVPSIGKLDITEMKNILRFIKRNEEYRFMLTEIIPCEIHKKEIIKEKKINICFVSGTVGYEAKPIEGDDYYRISLLNNVFVVKRKIADDKLNIYFHFPSEKILEKRSVMHAFNNFLVKFQFKEKSLIELRFNNLKSGIEEHWPGLAAWYSSIRKFGPQYEQIDKVEGIGVHVNSKYVLKDETPLPSLAVGPSARITGCVCMVCLHNKRQIGKWVMGAKFIITKLDQENKGTVKSIKENENKIDNKIQAEIDELRNSHQVLMNEIRRLTLMCQNLRPKWLKATSLSGQFCEGHSGQSGCNSVYTNYGFEESLHETVAKERQRLEYKKSFENNKGRKLSNDNPKLNWNNYVNGKILASEPLGSRFFDFFEENTRASSTVHGNDKDDFSNVSVHGSVLGISELESCPNQNSQKIKEEIGEYKENITNEQKAIFEQLEIVSMKDIDELLEDQEIDVFKDKRKTQLEAAGEKLPTNWREVLDLKKVPEFARDRVEKLLDKYSKALSLHKGQRGHLKLGIEVEYPTVDEIPIYSKNYQSHPSLVTFTEHLIKHMIDTGLVSECPNAWTLPIFLVHRSSKIKDILESNKIALNELEQNLESLRIVVDSRKLNAKLLKHTDNSISVKNTIGRMYNYAYISSFDFSGAYKSLRVSQNSKHKCGFEFQDKKYCFNNLCEGVSIGPRIWNISLGQVFKRSLDMSQERHPYSVELNRVKQKQNNEIEPTLDSHECRALHATQTVQRDACNRDDASVSNPTRTITNNNVEPIRGSSTVIYYVDDVLVTTYKTAVNKVEEHFQMLDLFFQDVLDSGLLLAAKKCIFFEEKEITYLGFVCTPKSFTPITERSSIFKAKIVPQTKAELYKFLGCAIYIMNHIPNLTLKLDRLFQVLKRVKAKHSKINLTQEEIELFNEVCDDLINPKHLYYMQLDLPLELSIDSSKRGMGSVLRQEYEPGLYRPILYYSKLFSKNIKISNSAYEHEILGLLTCVTSNPIKFYLQASPLPINIRMDAASVLVMLASMDGAFPSKITRWSNKIMSSGFSFKLLHASGKNGEFEGPDFLSRVAELVTDEQMPIRGNVLELTPEQIHIPDFAGQKTVSFESLKQMLEKNPDMIDNIIEYRDTFDEKQNKKQLERLILKPNHSKQDISQCISTKLGPKHADLLSDTVQGGNHENITVGHVNDIYASFTNLNKDQIIKEQSKDPFTSQLIRDILMKGVTQGNNRYKVLNGVMLVRLRNKKGKLEPSNYQIVVGFRYAVMLLGVIHALSHAGMKRCVKQFNRYFYAKNALQIAAEITVSCKICSRHNKMTGHFDSPVDRPITRTTNTLIIDHCFINRDNPVQKKIGFLNIVDSVSGFSFAKPVTSTKVSITKSIIANALELCGGKVRLLLSDNAQELANNTTIKELCKSLNCTTKTGIPRVIGSRSIVESSNKQLLDIIAKMSKMLNKPWTDVFSASLIVYNSLPGGLLNDQVRSKREIMFKTNEQSQFDICSLLQIDQEGTQGKRITRKINGLIQNALHKVKRQQIIAKEKFDKKTITKQIGIGSLVFVTKFDTVKKKKLSDSYQQNIYQVIARKGTQLFVAPILSIGTQKAKEVSVMNTKPFTPRLSQVFLYLPRHLQMLLGHPISPTHIVQAKRLGILPFDFQYTQIEHDFPMDTKFSDYSSSSGEDQSDDDFSVDQHFENFKELEKLAQPEYPPVLSPREDGSAKVVEYQTPSSQKCTTSPTPVIPDREPQNVHPNQPFESKSRLNQLINRFRKGAKSLKRLFKRPANM